MGFSYTRQYSPGFWQNDPSGNTAIDATHLNAMDAGIAAASQGLVRVASITSNTTLTDSNEFVLANAAGGAITITLPTAVGRTGKSFIVKRTNSGANTVTIDANSTETIDGSLTYTMSVQYESFAIVSDGANWMVV